MRSLLFRTVYDIELLLEKMADFSSSELETIYRYNPNLFMQLIAPVIADFDPLEIAFRTEKIYLNGYLDIVYYTQKQLDTAKKPFKRSLTAFFGDG